MGLRRVTRPSFPPSLALLALAEIVACHTTREPEAEVPVAASPPDSALADDASAIEARDAAEASDAAAEAALSQDTPAVEAQIATLLGEMTLDEKVGQLVM